VRRAVAAIIAPLLLLTAACSGSDNTSGTKPTPGTIDSVTVTGAFNQQPTIQFKKPMSFAKTESKKVITGAHKGDVVIGTSTVTVNYIGLNASTGETFDSSWGAGGKGKPATFKVSQVLRGLSMGLQGAYAGDRVLITIAPQDGFDPVGNGTTVQKGDSLVMVVDVLNVTNPRVVPAAELPTLTYDSKGRPSKFVAKKSTPPTVGLLTVHDLRTGTGRAVAANDTLTVRYLGQIWPDGAVFDENFTSAKPTQIPLSSTIEGWQQGLVGQKVGSRVVLAIPSELGYGAAGSGSNIPPYADLIFVVDILKASKAGSTTPTTPTTTGSTAGGKGGKNGSKSGGKSGGSSGH
jgi:FKBP-type peptidyl-prolyl cis-trans isomerase